MVLKTKEEMRSIAHSIESLEEKKPNTQPELNPLPLDHEACALQLCYLRSQKEGQNDIALTYNCASSCIPPCGTSWCSASSCSRTGRTWTWPARPPSSSSRRRGPRSRARLRSWSTSSCGTRILGLIIQQWSGGCIHLGHEILVAKATDIMLSRLFSHLVAIVAKWNISYSKHLSLRSFFQSLTHKHYRFRP